MDAGVTRAERRAVNRAAHAIRRELTNADYRDARERGDDIRWRDIAAVYDAMPAADVLTVFGTRQDDDTPDPGSSPAPRKRTAPAHIVAASAEYALALEAWRAGLEAAVAGGRTRENGGRPARGEAYPDEERDYMDAHPKPVWRDFVRETAATMRGTVNA